MTKRKILFVDRDGTLVEEPADEQLDELGKLVLLPGVIPALLRLLKSGYELVLVSNQDGRGTASFPEADFRRCHDFMLELFRGQGIQFADERICPHFPADDCECRKPRIGLVRDFVVGGEMDRERSYVIGDRETDLLLAENMGIRGLRLEDGMDWVAIAEAILGQPRRASVVRATRETNISATVDLDRAEPIQVKTGIGFLDHMLEQVAKHGGFSLELVCQGDLEVDEHHTVEDTAIVLGQAISEALGDRRGIGRYGFVLPMDEARAQIALDLSGRAFSVFEGRLESERVGGLPTELVPHFFRSFAESLGAALHLELRGENTHHIVEAGFKCLGRALRQAVRLEGSDLPSTKGVL